MTTSEQMDKKVKGSWLVHQTGKLQNVNSQAAFENTYHAGKAGILLSALSSDTQAVLDNSRVEALAKASNITVKLELPSLLETLKRQDLIEIGADCIEVLGTTTAATLQHTADIFEGLEPSASEEAAIALSEHCSHQPRSQDEVREEIADTYQISSEDIRVLFNESETIGFVDVEKIDSEKSLYFNGNLFRRENAKKVHNVLSSLSEDDQRLLVELNEKIAQSACVTTEYAERVLGEQLFNKLCSVGIFDVNVVSNSQEHVGYVTQPSAFSKFSEPLVDDAFDLAKAFVSSLMYGMTRSSYERGEIRMVEALLQTLIAGRPIGPVDAIANDYKVLELKNVVSVYIGQKNGRTGHMMRLLKQEVGILALEVIQQGDASAQSLSALPSAAITKYSGPEASRERKRRRQLDTNPKATNDILLALRTGRAFS